jgi:hypothetical protein
MCAYFDRSDKFRAAEFRFSLGSKSDAIETNVRFSALSTAAGGLTIDPSIAFGFAAAWFSAEAGISLIKISAPCGAERFEK